MRILLIDTEGTLFDNTHRLDMFKSGQWEEYDAACVFDTLIPQIANLLGPTGALSQLFDAAYLVSPRYEKYRDVTERQLGDCVYAFDDMLFRDPLDSFPKTKEVELKRQYLEKIKEWHPHDDLTIYAWEDRDDCVDMYRNAGVHCWQVAAGVLG